ncbi:hypothetical protein T439DRAFT_381239 [Meredithblackwellia eburnea MCA 4105]
MISKLPPFVHPDLFVARTQPGAQTRIWRDVTRQAKQELLDVSKNHHSCSEVEANAAACRNCNDFNEIAEWFDTILDAIETEESLIARRDEELETAYSVIEMEEKRISMLEFGIDKLNKLVNSLLAETTWKTRSLQNVHALNNEFARQIALDKEEIAKLNRKLMRQSQEPRDQLIEIDELATRFRASLAKQGDVEELLRQAESKIWALENVEKGKSSRIKQLEDRVAELGARESDREWERQSEMLTKEGKRMDAAVAIVVLQQLHQFVIRQLPEEDQKMALSLFPTFESMHAVLLKGTEYDDDSVWARLVHIMETSATSPLTPSMRLLAQHSIAVRSRFFVYDFKLLGYEPPVVTRPDFVTFIRKGDGQELWDSNDSWEMIFELGKCFYGLEGDEKEEDEGDEADDSEDEETEVEQAGEEFDSDEDDCGSMPDLIEAEMISRSDPEQELSRLEQLD